MIERPISLDGARCHAAVFCRHTATRSSARSALGPMPVQSVAALADLGLDDTEIARYFRVELHVVEELRHIARTRQAQ